MSAERFWAKVTKGGPDDCWLWTISTGPKGYGQFWRNGTMQRAHRVAWELTNGPIPCGLDVLHTCDVRRCVNPAHLFAGTDLDNQHDMIRKGRARHPKPGPKTHCKQGHAFDSQNTRIRRDNGTQQCRECHRQRDAEYYLRKTRRQA